MRNRHPVVLALGALILLGSMPALAATPAHPRYNRFAHDGTPVSVTNPLDGRTWSAWSYRAGSEHDIAVASIGPDGVWSDPVFLGADDRLDQVSPSLAVDASGHVYLVFAVHPVGRVLLYAMPRGGTEWQAVGAITARGEMGFAPAVAVIGERLVVAFRNAERGVSIREVGLLAPPVAGQGIQDGPDGVDPLGNGSDGNVPVGEGGKDD